MEPILTQEELEAIYSAMKADAGPSKSVDDYVLASDHSYNMRCLKKWTEVAKAVAPRLESLLIKRLAIRGKLEIQDVRTVEDERDSASLNQVSGMTEVIPLAQTDSSSEYVVISMGDAKVLLGMERVTSLKYISRRTGIDNNEETEEKGELTILEKRLLRDFFAEISHELEPVLNHGKIELLPEDPEDFWLDRIPRGTWINVQFTSSSNAEMCIWLRGPAELFISKTEAAPEAVENSLHKARVELVMELGKLSMKAYDLWNMRVGDVYPLGVAMDEALDVVVGGVYKLKGKPTISRGHVAFEIVENKHNGQVKQ